MATCRCGHVRLRASGRPLVTSACHCTGCRRMTGGPYSLGAIYAANAVVVEAGETRAIGADHGAGHQGCPRCASWVFSRPREVDDIVVVRSPLFEDAAAFPPFMETCTSDKLPFVDFTAPHRFARFPDPTEFPALIAAYAAWDQVEV
ncbi:GFA family protein [Methylobacterium sp. NEAU 140]|uniref:GFA family protein n=1 Tax=Methylobacterium sp. NEAU 140 TaxID=3064945 RepID=UPI00273636F9|nr:GFA family protein [Methylobacterium sp. NEAU 140]MDP4026219.1 GFA family protein [Methylobacterium sp. NEAU 140]